MFAFSEQFSGSPFLSIQNCPFIRAGVSHILNNLHNKIIIFVIYFNKITLILHPGSQYHVNIIGTHPHNLQSSSIIPPLLIYMVLPPPNLEDVPPWDVFGIFPKFVPK